MSFAKNLKTLGLGALALAGIAIAAPAQTLAASLEFSLTAEKASVIIGEPVVLRTTIRHTPKAPVPVVPTLAPTWGFATYEITAPGGTATAFQPAWLDDGAITVKTLAPGESKVEAVDLYYGAEGWTFDRPGDYSIVAIYDGQRSTPARLTVQPSANETQAKTSALMTEDDGGLFILAGGPESLVVARNNVRSLVFQHAHSVLSGYARYGMGTYLSRPGRVFKDAGSVRAPLTDKAIQMFSDAVKQPISDTFKIKCYSRLISLLVETKDRVGAQEAFRAFKDAYGTDPVAARYLRAAEAKL